MNVFIRQLTGIRFIAAAWVLLYHLQGPLNQLHLLIPVVSDVLRVGRLGVDLFFALSGFILTHTYLRRLGPSLRVRGTVDFWWLRLARIYPVHIVMLFVAGAAVVAQAKVTGADLNRDWLNPIDFIKNLLLIQEWGPDPQRGWNFVAWSLSMEWLAYLIFPLLVLLLWVLHRRIATWALVILLALAMSPLLYYGLSTSDPYYTNHWGSSYRILTEFTAGAITYLIVVRILPGDTMKEPATPRVERIASIAAVVLPLLVVAGAVFLGTWGPAQPPMPNVLDGDVEPLPPYYHLLLVPLLVLWIGSLALSRRGLARFLSTKTLVLGGFISYSLYMTHLVWFGLWRAGLRAAGIDSGALYAIAVLVLVAGALFFAWLMWRFVEEPAREFMRGLVGVRRTPTEEAGEARAEAEQAGDSADPVDVTTSPDDPFDAQERDPDSSR
ncbi:MAG: acyltransferase family protein [Actinomycetales bacterium]|nr:acyltransferase family protein [Actinomycetales bacterium]